MKKIAVLPSLLTLGNAFCGVLAICYTADALLLSEPGGSAVFHAKVTAAAWLVLVAMFFDALDGKVARITNLTSDFGGQLDSLCDALSFGLAPAFLVKVLVDHERMALGLPPHPKLLFVAAALFTICAILRLARFNVENVHGDDAHTHFKGLPTPGAAGAVASSVLLFEGFAESRISAFLAEAFPRYDPSLVPTAIRTALPFLVVLLGLLMVSRVTYMHFVNHALRERRPFAFLVQLLVIAAVAVVEPELAVALLFFGYILSGPLMRLREAVTGRRLAPEEDEEEEAQVS